MNTPARILAVLSTAATLPGCGLIFAVANPSQNTVAAGRFAGPACERVETHEQPDGIAWGRRAPGPIDVHAKSLETGSTMIDVGGKTTGPGPGPSADADMRVLSVACVDYSRDTYVAAWLHELDPTSIDHFAVATLFADCNRSIGCLGEVDPEHPLPHDEYLAGLMAWYAVHVDPDAVKAELAQVDVPAAAATIFLQRFEAARADIETIAGAMDGPRKAVLLDIPLDAAEEAVALRTEHAEDLARVEELAAKARHERGEGVSDGTLAALSDLRGAYVRGCGSFDCLHDPVGHALARELFFAHISRVDVPGAMAEIPFLPEGSFAERVAKRQAEQMRLHERAHETVQRGIEQGLDRDTATATADGVEPVSFEGVYPLSYDKIAKDWDSMIPPAPGKLQRVKHRVKRTTTDGATTTLYFFDDVKTWKQEVCRDTGRIDRIDGGRVYYKQKCHETGKTESYRREHEPIVVPTAEARAIRSKEWVSVVAITGAPWTGHVTSVRRAEDGPAIQVRNVRLK